MSDQPTGANAASGNEPAPAAAKDAAAGKDVAKEARSGTDPNYQDQIIIEMVDMDDLPSEFATDQLAMSDLRQAVADAAAQQGSPQPPLAPTTKLPGRPATPAPAQSADLDPADLTPSSAASPVYAAPYVAAAFDAAVAAADNPPSATTAALPPDPSAAGEPPKREVYQGEAERYSTGFLTYLSPAVRGPGSVTLSLERQAYLAERYAMRPNTEEGFFRFKDIEPKLSRADIEWLLASHESRGIRGPVDWNEEEHRARIGLDLRGADLSGLDLSGLPLARLRMGLSSGEWLNATAEIREQAVTHLEGANLREAHLEGANLRGARLQGADLTEVFLTQATLVGARLERCALRNAHFEEADLSEAFLAGVDLSEAHCEGADLHGARLEHCVMRGARLERANLDGAHLEQANLESATLDNASLNGAYLESAVLNGARLKGANLYGAHAEWAQFTGARLDGAFFNDAHLESALFNSAHLERADLRETRLQGTSLRAAHLEAADLRRATLDDTTILVDVVLGSKQFGSAALGDIRWGGVDLTVVDWRHVKRLGDERGMRGRDATEAGRGALRAYRQLAAQLRGQGMSEEADRFAYQALVCERATLLRRGRIPHWLFSWFLALLTGYGYRPARALIWYALIVVGFAVVSLQVAPGGLAAASFTTWRDALFASLTNFHGRGFFQVIQNPNNLITLLPPFEAVIGLVIELTFGITTARRYVVTR